MMCKNAVTVFPETRQPLQPDRRKNIYEKIKFTLAIILTLCIVTVSRRNVSAFAVSVDNISPEIMFEIQRDAEELSETGVIGYGVDVLENRGFISVLKSSYNKFLRSYNANDMVYIEQLNDYISEEVSLIGGTPIKNSSGDGLTLGGSGTYNGSVAFLTCGHAMRTGTDLFSGGTAIGTTSLVQYSSCGNNNRHYRPW